MTNYAKKNHVGTSHCCGYNAAKANQKYSLFSQVVQEMQGRMNLAGMFRRAHTSVPTQRKLMILGGMPQDHEPNVLCREI